MTRSGDLHVADDTEIRLKQLENERELALEAIRHMGGFISRATLPVVVTGLIAIGGAVVLGAPLLSGTQLMVIFLAIIAAFVIVFGFIFGRLVKIDLELSKERRRLRIDAGKRAG